MDRRTEILRGIEKSQQGIEIGPWFNPLAPRSQGYKCLSLDVFDKDSLVRIAIADPLIKRESILNIEEVDFKCNTSEIENSVRAAGKLGTFDYILSSHNFEHIPNPIKFLQGCGNVLKKNGLLSMAIPDKRTCFDYFRPHTPLASWIESFMSNRDRPSLTQHFEQMSLHSRFKRGEELLAGFSLTDDPAKVVACQTVREALDRWNSMASSNDNGYQDCHCSIFTPNSFRLLIMDCAFLELSPFSVESVSEANGNEFYARLRNTGIKKFSPDETRQYYEQRQIVLHNIEDEIGSNSISTSSLRKSHEELVEHKARVAEICRKIGAPGENLDALAKQLSVRLSRPSLLRRIARKIFK